MTPQNDTPWWDPDAKAESDVPPVTPQPENGSHPRRLDSSWRLITDWVHQNIHTTIYMLIGLAVAIAFLCFGFWRTLLVAICLGVGYTLGSWRDGNPRLKARISRFYARWIDDNPFMK